ncbi:MAG: response regulator [Pyrinomonadaceae bacterium]
MSQAAKTVLVVEDYDDTRDMIRMLLEMKGCRVVEAANGKSGVEEARREKPALIFMDLNLPVLDGFKATEEIKKEAGLLHIPVIAMSAHCWDFDWKEKALGAGCVECVGKPLEFEVVGRMVDRYC